MGLRIKNPWDGLKIKPKFKGLNTQKENINMPQLDSLTFLAQYTWTLLFLFLLFLFVVTNILPKLQQQLAIRTKYVRGSDLHQDTTRVSDREGEGLASQIHLAGSLIKTPKGIKTLWNFK